MKTIINLSELPGSGVKVVVEGELVRLFFDFTQHVEPAEEGQEAVLVPNLYDCQNVDAIGHTKGDLVSAIVNDRYSADQVQALTANYAMAQDPESGITEEKRAEYNAEYAEYQTWRAHAKDIAVTALQELQ